MQLKDLSMRIAERRDKKRAFKDHLADFTSASFDAVSLHIEFSSIPGSKVKRSRQF